MSEKIQYIERKPLLKLLNGWLKECEKDAEENGGEAELIAMGLSDAIDGVKDATIVDAERVVRCKDCLCATDKTKATIYCNHFLERCDKNFYCAYGKAKE